MKQLKIGTMAEVCSTTPRALRHYQDEGILQPEIVDEESGYRSYSIMQSTKLDMITQLQSAGFTLREIAQIENAKDIDYLHDQAQARSAELERQIQELMLAKKNQRRHRAQLRAIPRPLGVRAHHARAHPRAAHPGL